MYLYHFFHQPHFMKNLFTFSILAIMFLSQTALSQSTRMVLIEEATNASCGPCASQNPAFDILLNANRDKLTAIKYHWYFPGYDPMHNHNPQENNSRVSYYSISGVPTATIDGDIPNGPTFSYPGGPHGYTQDLIDQYAAVPAPLDMWLSHHLSADEDTIFVDMLLQATEDLSGTLRAQMVVVEKHVHFTSAPGGNGEKDFNDVMKKMIPNEGGFIIPNLNDGEYIILQGSWELANIYDMDELGVVGFVQNNIDKNVLQAGNSTSDPLSPLYTVDSDILGVSNMSETNCLGEAEPAVTIRNNGSVNITSMEIEYDVNGEQVFTFPWTGDLGFLESVQVQLPKVSFLLADTNFLTINVTAVNGQGDDYLPNNVLVYPFERAAITPNTVKLMLKTDAHPEQNTWEIINSLGEIIKSGGPYANANTIYQETILLPAEDCYLFKLYDTGGDGLTMPGFYAFYYGSNSYIITGTTFGSVDSAYFHFITGIGIPESTPVTFSLYPNPVSEMLSVDFMNDIAAPLSVRILDLTGRTVTAKSYGIGQIGMVHYQLDVRSLKPGSYIVTLEMGNNISSQKISVIR
jgi:hypothetical protein